MRKGQNPAKAGAQAYHPQRLGMASLVYIPFQSGYYEKSLEIFQIHHASLRQYTDEVCDTLVFDNGSCPEVKQALHKMHADGLIDWLILSDENLGKTGALNMILAAMPNEWICFSDSDMLFREGWLEACWRINDAFPHCGMIGAQVVFPDREVDRGNSAFRHGGDPRYQFSQEKPAAWIVKEYCSARGASPERAAVYSQMSLDKVHDHESGVDAYLGGNSHQQFLARRAVLQRILPLPSGLELSREQDTYQDQRLDELGYSHLTTTQPYLYHMGNTIDNAILPEIQRLAELQFDATAPLHQASDKKNLIWKLLVEMNRHAWMRRLMLRLYQNMYEVISR